MIQVINHSQLFNLGSPNETLALDNVSMTINKGEYVVLLGANGSGKSTLLNSIAGSHTISSGQVLFDKTDVTSLKEYQRSKWVSRIFQNPLLGTAPDLSVLDNFRLAAIRTQTKTLRWGTSKKFVDEVAGKIATLQMGLENKLNVAMGSLSGGQRQALTLIMAVMDEAHILLMDEPTAALDPKSASMIMEKSAEIIQAYQLTAILVTHNMKDAHQYGNRITLMQEGKITKDLYADAKKALQLQELYGWF